VFGLMPSCYKFSFYASNPDHVKNETKATVMMKNTLHGIILIRKMNMKCAKPKRKYRIMTHSDARNVCIYSCNSLHPIHEEMKDHLSSSLALK
jgi:hypothetical protein